jgi:broad specificity phosphatase PhoE
MPLIEVRRHAERADRADEQSGLSVAGRARCERVARGVGPYELVVTSPLARARETALLLGGRVDRVEAGLLPELHGLSFAFWDALDDLPAYDRFAGERDGAREIGTEQGALWSALAATLGADSRALAVSHGAVIELGAVVLARRLGIALSGPAFGYCEGVAVSFAAGTPRGIELLRVT